MSVDDKERKERKERIEGKENLRYTLERLYKCRDLEISNLWQRSVFLSVFLILCFSAYGYLMSEMVKVNDHIVYENMSINSKMDNLIGSLKIKESTHYALQNYNLVAICISCVSIIFSILWIGIAKGSKAWYEVYEDAICRFEDKYFKELGIINEGKGNDFRMGKMSFPPSQKNDSFFATKAGGYSPSRINIAIGQISLIGWMIICVFHICGFLPVYFSDCLTGNSFMAIVVLLLTLGMTVYLRQSDYIKSGFFSDKKKES